MYNRGSTFLNPKTQASVVDPSDLKLLAGSRFGKNHSGSRQFRIRKLLKKLKKIDNFSRKNAEFKSFQF